MQEELAKIDVAPADALKALKDEQDVLEGRIRTMEEKKAAVAEAVYARVKSDYSARLDALRAQAHPLKEQARAQYGQLRAILATLEAAQEAVKLDQQEIELRHTLGEFDKKEFDKRIKALETQAAEKQQWHQQAQEIRARFAACVHSESELEAAAAPPPSAPASSSYITGEVPMPSAAAVAAASAAAAAPRAAPPGFDAGTMVMPAIPRQPAPAPPPAAAPAAAPAPAATSDATVVFRPARLVPQNPEAGKNTFSIALKPMAIGSETGNDIRLGSSGVDGKHARITPTPQGFVLSDLDSKQGTRVNAEKIREHVLKNEDVIQIGVARFVFRT
ncbi:MAG TPA: FHA domain-containing protein [Xanthomonadales bacterium]|nr:FHA domain-containing protein [Xanthomonadales bacterium]